MSAAVSPAAVLDPTEARRQRGLAIAALSKIVQKNGQWVVPSQTGCGNYRVNLSPNNPAVPLCTCPDFMERGEPCKHVYAVKFVLQRETAPDGTETVTETLTLTRKAVAPRPTYRQNWPAYNAAQVNEKAKFQAILRDLCWGIPEPIHGKGEAPVPLADRVFSIAFKVYCTLSSRRFSCDLADAHAKGYLSRPPHYNSIIRFMGNAELTPILHELIAESARPLRAVETRFAVDSSGFTTSRFYRWFDHKYGVVKQEYDWVKAHLTTGVKTNIVTAVQIGERYAADCPQFQPMLQTTARNFKIEEVSADTAYSSYENCEAVAAAGGVPFIAFKANATGAQGGIYEKMLHYYQYRRDDFLAHYHARSNVESTFSMVKAKFGDAVRSKMDVAMKNEVLCKILCHNICVLIGSNYELGIAATFWGKDAVPTTECIAGESSTPDELEAWAWV